MGIIIKISVIEAALKITHQKYTKRTTTLTNLILHCRTTWIYKTPIDTSWKLILRICALFRFKMGLGHISLRMFLNMSAVLNMLFRTSCTGPHKWPRLHCLGVRSRGQLLNASQVILTSPRWPYNPKTSYKICAVSLSTAPSKEKGEALSP